MGLCNVNGAPFDDLLNILSNGKPIKHKKVGLTTAAVAGAGNEAYAAHGITGTILFVCPAPESIRYVGSRMETFYVDNTYLYAHFLSGGAWTGITIYAEIFYTD